MKIIDSIKAFFSAKNQKKMKAKPSFDNDCGYEVVNVGKNYKIMNPNGDYFDVLIEEDSNEVIARLSLNGLQDPNWVRRGKTAIESTEELLESLCKVDWDNLVLMFKMEEWH